MNRFDIGLCAVVLSAVSATGPAVAAPDPRLLPMRFEQWTEGPAQMCGSNCRTWVSATGAITADTPRDFEDFAKAHKLDGHTIALDSDGGSVHGALALGRAIRRLGMTTTVGKTAPLSDEAGEKRAKLLPQASCESMCAFVLLAGVERRVPAEARVLVHQIWLGDRRDDPTAASYSAEDLALVQRDIGRLMQYTVEMSGSIDLLDIALKIPPWEPMRLLSRAELSRWNIAVIEGEPHANSGAAAWSGTPASDVRAAIGARRWAMHADAEPPALKRKHPLTVEGENLGTFELRFACSDSHAFYGVTYSERRRGSQSWRMPEAVSAVEIFLLGRAIPLKVIASRASGRPRELKSVATGRVPAELLRAFAESGNGSLMVQTASANVTTTIRIGNSDAATALTELAASCAGQTRARGTARHDVRRGG